MNFGDFYNALNVIIFGGFIMNMHYFFIVFGGGSLIFVILEKTVFFLNKKND